MSEFLLTTEPTEIIVFVSEKLGEEAVTVNLKLTNPTSKDIVFKVKCTSNEMFRIRPPMGILLPGKSENIRLVFNPGKAIPENRKHYFAVYHINKAEDAASKTARELWAEHTGNPEGTKRLYVEFKKDKASADGKQEGGNAADTKAKEGDKKPAAEGEKKESGAATDKKDAEKKESEKKENGGGEKKEADKKEGEKKDGADAEKKEGADAEKKDKDADAEKKDDAEKKSADGEKDKEGGEKDKEGDGGKDGDKKEGNGEKKDADKKDAPADGK